VYFSAREGAWKPMGAFGAIREARPGVAVAP
jgi:hypothetical protein